MRLSILTLYYPKLNQFGKTAITVDANRSIIWAISLISTYTLMTFSIEQYFSSVWTSFCCRKFSAISTKFIPFIKILKFSGMVEETIFSGCLWTLILVKDRLHCRFPVPFPLLRLPSSKCRVFNFPIRKMKNLESNPTSKMEFFCENS